jgi:lipopolysaccharide heptosyltransferase II
LVVRPDRLGDVILSTPVLEVIKKKYPQAHISVLVRAGVAPLLRGLSSIDQVLIFDPDHRHAGLRGFFRLVAELKAGQFRFAIVLQSNWKIAMAVFFAGIRDRIGPLSKLHSFIFYNLGVRQRRSQVEMHEADYNLSLLKKIGIRSSSRQIQTRVSIAEGIVLEARQWLEKKGWTPEGRQTIVIHPGMGGSALNWPESHYQDLVKALVLEGYQVLVTGGAGEVALLDRMEVEVSPFVQGALGKLIFYRGSVSQSIDFLGGLLKHADLMIAPSTGPLHLAVALNLPVVTFFPPIRVQSAIRWGPYLADEQRASVLVPEVYCGQDFRCLGTPCHYYPCMKGLSVNQAIEQARLQLRFSNPHPKSESPKE